MSTIWFLLCEKEYQVLLRIHPSNSLEDASVSFWSLLHMLEPPWSVHWLKNSNFIPYSCLSNYFAFHRHSSVFFFILRQNLLWQHVWQSCPWYLQISRSAGYLKLSGMMLKQLGVHSKLKVIISLWTSFGASLYMLQ